MLPAGTISCSENRYHIHVRVAAGSRVGQLTSSAGTARRAGLVTMTCCMGSIGSAGTARVSCSAGTAGRVPPTKAKQSLSVVQLCLCSSGCIPLCGPPHGIRVTSRQHNGSRVALESGHAPHLVRMG